MAKISKTTPENGGKKQKKLASELPVDGDAKSLVSDLVKIFGTAELTQIDGTPTPKNKLRDIVDSVRKGGIAGFTRNDKGEISGAIIRYPLGDKPTETYL